MEPRARSESCSRPPSLDESRACDFGDGSAARALARGRTWGVGGNGAKRSLEVVFVV